MKINDDFAESLPADVKSYVDKTLRKVKSFGERDFVIRELFKPSTYLLNRDGKLLRPSLLFLGARALGEKCDKFVDLAAAIELLHVSSLIHDDIIDNGQTRRGVKAVNAKYGSSVALLAGNALISKAIQLSSRYGENVMNAVSATVLRMCAGELLDYKSQKDSSAVSTGNYIRIAELKTAALTGISCSIVALYKGSSNESVLYDYGANIGMAFQIRDDILDFVGLENSHSHSNRPNSNIVLSMKEKYGSDKNSALKRAARLNNYYTRRALEKVKHGSMRKVLESYARMLEVNIS